jgi:hypothetical protein
MMIPATKSAEILRMSDPAITLVMKGSVEFSSAISKSYSSSSSAIPSSRRRLSEIFLLYTSFSLIFRACLANITVCDSKWVLMLTHDGEKASTDKWTEESTTKKTARNETVDEVFMVLLFSGGSTSVLAGVYLLREISRFV